MRAARRLALICFTALSLAPVAAPAIAQSLQATMDAQLRASELQAQQDMAARQAVLQQNQLTVLEAQIRAEQAIADVQAQGRSRPSPPLQGGARLDAGQFASIPDDRLAASNARVKAAADNHH